jgi:hypothetical protein
MNDFGLFLYLAQDFFAFERWKMRKISQYKRSLGRFSMSSGGSLNVTDLCWVEMRTSNNDKNIDTDTAVYTLLTVSDLTVRIDEEPSVEALMDYPFIHRRTHAIARKSTPNLTERSLHQ